MGLISSYTWDCNGGVVTRVVDPNSQPTNYGHDQFWAINSVTDPLLNIFNTEYTPATVETYLNFPASNPTSTVDTLNTLDGLGRLVTSQKRTAPGSTSFDSAIQYAYGWNSQAGTVTGPFTTQTVPGGTAITTQQFDASGRLASVVDGGGGTVSQSYPLRDALGTATPAPAGENPKTRQLEYDGIGRLTSVCEVTAGAGSGSCGQSSPETGFLTKYSYSNNASGNPTVTVTQNAQPGAIGGAQTRSYTYDGLGRLTSEANPETGTTNYTYDTDSGCGTYTGDLVKKVDTAGNVTCFAYDKLHRRIGVTYPSGPYASVTPAKTFVYDATTFSCPNGANVAGKLAEAYTGPATAKITDIAYCYSPRGETTDAFESTPNSGGTYHTTATYWADGILNTLGGVPGLSGWTFTPDTEGRPYSATYGGSTNWVTSTTYYPSNPRTTVMFGTGDSDVYGYDLATGRLNSFQFTLGTTPQTLSGTPGWNANGTLGSLALTDPFNSANTQNCSYVYDDLVRAKSVNCTNGSTTVWNNNFSLDAFGNISKSGSTSFAASYVLANGTTSNQEQSVGSCVPTYDANGNMTKDCSFISPPTYAWDADGNAITLHGQPVTYDAFDREVEFTAGSTIGQILYSPIGKLGLMNGQTPATIRIPLPGGSVARMVGSGGTTYILHSDWLGSSRLTTNYSGRSVWYDTAYAPFGENYSSSKTSTADLDFTGQFQDTLAGLYDFLYRENDPVQGRWISPDPAGVGSVDPSNPQSWNRYAYVSNNPLNHIDPLGLAEPEKYGPCKTREVAFYLWSSQCPGESGPFTDGGSLCNLDGGFVPCVFLDGPDEGSFPTIPVRMWGCWGDCGYYLVGFTSPNANCFYALASPCGGSAANNGTPQTPCSSARNAPSPRQYQAMGYVAQASWLFGPGVGGLSNAGTLAMFKRGLPLDAQVIYGGSQAYANYSYGVFMSAAGYPLNFALWGANAYASSQSSYPQNTPMDPNYPSTPASNVANITAGFNAQQNGTLCHK